MKRNRRCVVHVLRGKCGSCERYVCVAHCANESLTNPGQTQYDRIRMGASSERCAATDEKASSSSREINYSKSDVNLALNRRSAFNNFLYAFNTVLAPRRRGRASSSAAVSRPYSNVLLRP